jgi:tripartite-type tricarboxylate transporter receptor subunit TctC
LPGAAGSVAVSKSSPDEFAAIIKADTAKWAKVIRDAGIKASE